MGGPDEVTKVMITINLKDHNKLGFSLMLLNEVIGACTEKLASYRIFHSPEGLTITGTYR
ncbi:MAG: hypothetical protein GTO63_05780 [Anaerolineae bacterium]|nr:hypothetical protein [Anaerolineae bacterium]NIN94483.1 hypothetical protein [Anaerolineae bacterium]NIQ77551.1 hypothetical protein [Anaerolineae bacterium]